MCFSGLSAWWRTWSDRWCDRRSLGFGCRLENIRLASVTPKIKRTLPVMLFALKAESVRHFGRRTSADSPFRHSFLRIWSGILRRLHRNDPANSARAMHPLRRNRSPINHVMGGERARGQSPVRLASEDVPEAETDPAGHTCKNRLLGLRPRMNFRRPIMSLDGSQQY